MRILLDESLPRPLVRLLSGHDTRNGELLKLAAGSFDALLTADQNLEHQQNLGALPVAVVVLVAPTSRIESLQPLIPALLRVLESLAPRESVRVGA